MPLAAPVMTATLPLISIEKSRVQPNGHYRKLMMRRNNTTLSDRAAGHE
jgi:hypothetical protein